MLERNKKASETGHLWGWIKIVPIWTLLGLEVLDVPVTLLRSEVNRLQNVLKVR